MADEADSAAVSYVKALAVFTENGEALLGLAEKESGEGSLQEFIRQNIRIERKQSLLGLIEAGATLYRSLSVKRKKDAEGLWSKNNHCDALRAAVQDFQQLEARWDAFLRRLDDELQLTAETLHRSKCIPAETSLTNAKTGERVTLESYLGKGKKILLVLIRQFSCLLCRLHLKDLQKNQGLIQETSSVLQFSHMLNPPEPSRTEEVSWMGDATSSTSTEASLDAHSIEVVVVSFGCQQGASHWLQETDCHYDMLLDPHRKLYAAFGLGASLRKVLNFSNMLLYAEYAVDNVAFPRDLPSIQDDMFQLGGDFVLSEHGKVLFSHCCQSPIDRPPVEDILSALRT